MAEGGIQIRVESQGIDELKEIFDKLPAKVAKRPLQSTLRRAAKPLEQEVKNTLPVRLKDMGQAVTTKNMRSFAGVKTGRVFIPSKDGQRSDQQGKGKGNGSHLLPFVLA